MKLLLSLVLLFELPLLGSSQYFPEFDIDITNFEDYYDYSISIDTSAQNLWEVGTPSQSFFDSAYSVPYAIVTDTMNNYTPNNNSFFDLKFYPNNPYYISQLMPQAIFFEIKHKYDTDTLRDGGSISISHDNGLSFTNIILDSNVCADVTPFNAIMGEYYNDSLYSTQDTLYNGEFGFSGKSNGWITTRFAWFTYPVKCQTFYDTTILRFSFKSDSIETNKEGWMIDNIRLYYVELPGSVNENQMRLSSVFPNPASNSIRIELNNTYSDLSVALYSLEGKLIAKKNYNQINTLTFSLEKVPNGLYLLKILSDNIVVGNHKIRIEN